jgi:hypothetical protein
MKPPRLLPQTTLSQPRLFFLALWCLAACASILWARAHEGIDAWSSAPYTSDTSYAIDAPTRIGNAKGSQLLLAGRPLALGQKTELSVVADARGDARVPIVLAWPSAPRDSAASASAMYASTPASYESFGWDGSAFVLHGLVPGAGYTLRAAFHYRDKNGEAHSAPIADCQAGCVAAFGAPELAAPPSNASPFRRAWLERLLRGETPYIPFAILAAAIAWRSFGRSLARRVKVVLGLAPDGLPMPVRTPKVG